MGIGNLGVSELMVVAVLVLLLFGPRRLPEIGRTVGQALREFKRGMNEVKRELEEMDRGSDAGGPERPDARDAPRGELRPPGPTPGVREGERGSDSTAPDEAAAPGEEARAEQARPEELHPEDGEASPDGNARQADRSGPEDPGDGDDVPDDGAGPAGEAGGGAGAPVERDE